MLGTSCRCGMMVQRHMDFAVAGGKGLPVVLFDLVVLHW